MFAKTAGALPNYFFCLNPLADAQRPIDASKPKIISADNAAGALTLEMSGATKR
jgi:hypothetical protein